MVILVNKTRPRGIIWLASYPRSGNTWIRAFTYALVNVIRDPGCRDIDINRIDEFSASESSAEPYQAILGKAAFRASPAEVAAARPKVQADLVQRLGRPVFVKTHNARIKDHGMPLINMGVSAGAIYIVRNPLDVVVSVARYRDIPIDQAIDEMATEGFAIPTDRQNVQIVTGSWSENVRSWSRPPHAAVLTVRYEDLYAEPIENFSKVAKHLLIPPVPEQIEKAVAMTRFETLQEKEAASGFAENPGGSSEPFFRGGRPDQWREVLTPAQVDRVVDANRPVMKDFGYLPDQAA